MYTCARIRDDTFIKAYNIIYEPIRSNGTLQQMITDRVENYNAHAHIWVMGIYYYIMFINNIILTV